MRPQDAKTPAERVAACQARMNEAHAAYAGLDWIAAPEQARAAQARAQREARNYVLADRAARGDDVAAELLELRLFADAAAEAARDALPPLAEPAADWTPDEPHDPEPRDPNDPEEAP